MKDIKNFINEVNIANRAKVGNVLEVELNGDEGKFFWHTPNQKNDWHYNGFEDMKPWEVKGDLNRTFFIKIGDVKDLEEL